MASPRAVASRRSVFALGFAVLAVAALGWTLPQDAPPGRPGGWNRGPREHSPLGDQMVVLKKNLKELAQGLEAERPAETLVGNVVAMEQAALAAKALTPANLELQPEDQREAHTRAFRADLARLLIQLADMEIDLLEGRPDAVKERINGPLFDLRDASHEKYEKPEEGHR